MKPRRTSTATPSATIIDHQSRESFSLVISVWGIIYRSRTPAGAHVFYRSQANGEAVPAASASTNVCMLPGGSSEECGTVIDGIAGSLTGVV